MSNYKAVVVEKGPGGWGGPLRIEPKGDRVVVASITGGGIHPVAQRIADLTGGEAFDAFKSTVKFDKMACAVIDCGGTARVGVYPMKGVPTVDVHPTSPAGPLAQFIKETNFVSGVKLEQVKEA
jgi:PTS system glucitol/sorbitol-specific IIB component